MGCTFALLAKLVTERKVRGWGLARLRLKNWIRRLCEGPARYSLVKGERIVRQQLYPRRMPNSPTMTGNEDEAWGAVSRCLWLCRRENT